MIKQTRSQQEVWDNERTQDLELELALDELLLRLESGFDAAVEVGHDLLPQRQDRGEGVRRNFWLVEPLEDVALQGVQLERKISLCITFLKPADIDGHKSSNN